MKKAIKISATSILIILIGLTYSSCKKESKQEGRITAKENQSPPTIPNAGGGGMEYNYCQWCGYTTNPTGRCRDWAGSSECHESIYCAQTNMNQYIAANDDGSTPSLNNEFAYYVRDSFLVNFTKGNDYITYNNIIGDVMYNYNVLNSSNFMAHYDLATELSVVMDNLINGPDDCIPVTSTFRAHAIDMIDYYRTIDNSVVFNDVLDIIQEDVIALEGMTKANIYASYN